jgi:hypothetical protein
MPSWIASSAQGLFAMTAGVGGLVGVNCRCSIVGVMLEQEPPTSQFEYERAHAGVRFGQWRAAPEANRRTVLRGLGRAGLLDWLKDNPLGDISVVRSLRDEFGPFHGVYEPN